MIGCSLRFFAYFLSLSLYVNHALARVSNITFSDHPTTCSPLTVSWEEGVPPFTVVFLTVDAQAQLEPDGTIPGNLVRVAEVGNARRVLWTAAIQAGEVLVAIVRDGLQQNFSSAKRVVQASNDVTCLAALTSMDTLTGSIALPSLSTRPIGPSTNLPSGSLSIRPTATSTNLISTATLGTSEASNSLNTNQRRFIALPVLLTLFTVGIVVGLSVYGFCILRSGALRRSDTHYDDIEGGRHGGDTRIRILGTYSKELGRSITRKISAMGSQLSRRPTPVVATEKGDSFTMETSPPTPQEVSQLSPGGRADVVEPKSIIGAPIIPVHAINAPRPASSVTVPTASRTTDIRTGLGPPRPRSTPNGKGLRPAPSRSSLRSQNRPLPIPPALDLSRQGTQRQYGLPTANNRLEAMRPRSRSKSVTIAEPIHKRASSATATRRSASAGVIATLDSPPAHFAQVPISALPTASPFSSSIRPYSRVSGRPSIGPGATIQGSSRRRGSNTMGSIIVVKDVPFVTESPRFNRPTARPRADPRASLTPSANVLEPFIIPSSSPRSEAGSHVDPFYDIPQTATTTVTRYSMALPESGSLLPTPFSVSQDEVVPPLPSTSIPLSMLAKLPSRATSPNSGATPVK